MDGTLEFQNAMHGRTQEMKVQVDFSVQSIRQFWIEVREKCKGGVKLWSSLRILDSST